MPIGGLLVKGAASANPIGLGLSVASSLLGPVVGIFTAHHKNAVAKENSTLGYAQPKFENSVSGIVQQWQAGVISAGDASAKLDEALAVYVSDVRSIMQKSGKAGDTGDPHAGGKCNAACFILKNQYEPLIKNIKSQIASGTGVKTVTQQSAQGGLPGGPGAYQGVPDNPNVSRAGGAPAALTMGVAAPAGGIQLSPALAVGIGVVVLVGIVVMTQMQRG